MKIACTSDWHVHNFTDFSRYIMTTWDEESRMYKEVEDCNAEDSKEMNSRLFNILNGLCYIRDYCINNSIEHVLMAGDLFHKRGTIDVTVLNSVYKVITSFEELGVHLHILSGNHDQVDASQLPSSSVHLFKDMSHVIEKPEYFRIEDKDGESVEVVAVPYSKDKEFVIDSMSKLNKTCKHPEQTILMAHLGVTGGVTGSGMYVMSDEYSLSELTRVKWKYIVLGHYHRPQLLSKRAFYCGTPVQNTFNDEIKGENGYNGFFVVDTCKRYDITFVPIIAPRFITVSSVEELKKYSKEYLESNYVRVKSSAEDVETIKDTIESILGDENSGEVRLELEKTYDTESRSDIGVSMSFSEAIETYVQEKYTGSINDFKVLEVGLDILSEATSGGN